MLRFLYLILPLLIASCGHHANSNSGTKGNSIPVTDDGEPLGDFYKRYNGDIEGQAVVVHLHNWNGVLQGSYQYVSIGQTITLQGGSDKTSSDAIILKEMAVDGRNPNGNTATWSITVTGSTAKGEWTSSDGSQPLHISLREEYPSGSMQLDARYARDSVALAPDVKDGPKAVSSVQYLVPQGSRNNFQYNSIRAQIAPGSGTGDDIGAAVQAENRAYFDDYIKINSAIFKEKSRLNEVFSFNYTSDKTITVLYNDDNWLVTEYLFSTYTGGAHGSYGSSFANMDISQQRIWSVTDMVTDTAALRPVLNDAAIQYFGLKPDAGMDGRMLVNEVPPTANVYISGKGLSFVYNPYEIASYADGEVSLFLPYQKIMALLTPAFKTRMHLSENSGVARR